MSNNAFWTIFAAWGVVIVGGLILGRRSVIKQEAKLEAEAIEKDFIAEEKDDQRRFSRDAAVPVRDSAWQERARRAEALGFIDNDPELPRSA